MLKRAAILTLPLLLATGCGGLGVGDYFRIEEDNTWSFFVRNSELNDEQWTLSVLDADDNEENQRGSLYWQLRQTYKDDVNPTIEHAANLRAFNLSPDYGGQGEDAVPVAWIYKYVNTEEGLRNENFLVQPGTESDWSASWEFTVRESFDFVFDIEMAYETEPIQTSLGTFEDTLAVTRTRTWSSGGDPLLNVRQEWWAVNVGLIRYIETGADGLSVEGVVRTTNFETE